MDDQITLRCIAWKEGAPLLQEVREAACKLGILNPIEAQSDDLDDRCRHALALSKNGLAIGCARVTPDGKIERVAVLSQEFGTQIENALIEAVLIEMLDEYSRKGSMSNNSVASNKSQTRRRLTV